jgi:hypothetical protein
MESEPVGDELHPSDVMVARTSLWLHARRSKIRGGAWLTLTNTPPLHPPRNPGTPLGFTGEIQVASRPERFKGKDGPARIAANTTGRSG